MSEQMRWYSVNDPKHKPTGLCLIAYRNPKGGWFYSTDFAGQDGSFEIHMTGCVFSTGQKFPRRKNVVRIELTASGILPIKRSVPMKDGVSIIRKVDDIGRVLIPKDICQRFGWLPGTPLEILVGDDCVVYRRYKHYARVSDVIKELKDLVACDEEVDWRDRAEINNLLKEIERILRKSNE